MSVSGKTNYPRSRFLRPGRQRGQPTRRQNPVIYPFREARVEGFGSGAGRRKRKDLRFFDLEGKLILCGEVKLPGTLEGQSAVNHKLMTDAHAKADNAGVQYFFTWNVNEFALWDRSLWDRPWFERRVCIWRLERLLTNPADVAREDNLQFIKTHFLPNCSATWPKSSPAVGATGRCPPMTSLSASSKATWIGRSCCSAPTFCNAEKERGKAFDLRVQKLDEGTRLDASFARRMRSGPSSWTTWPRPWPMCGRTG